MSQFLANVVIHDYLVMMYHLNLLMYCTQLSLDGKVKLQHDYDVEWSAVHHTILLKICLGGMINKLLAYENNLGVQSKINS